MGASNKTILLVEDEAIVAMAEKSELERFGYGVITANTGLFDIRAPRRERLFIAFCDLDGFASIAQRLGDDLALFELMDGYATAAELALANFGLVTKWMGDEFLFVSEDPDSGLRALLDAKTILEAHLVDRGLDATLRIQAHVGEAVIGPFGPRGAIDLYGESVNRAATIVRERIEGCLALSPEAYRALSEETQALFQPHPREPIYLRIIDHLALQRPSPPKNPLNSAPP